MTTPAQPDHVRIGQTLPNGALLLAVAENKSRRTTYCLALAHPDTNYAEYVTWAIGERLETFWGDYHNVDLASAMASLNDRAGVNQ